MPSTNSPTHNLKMPEGQPPQATPWSHATVYGNHFGDETFLFLVGPSETKFHVHPRVLSVLSKPFAALMSNGMKESLDRLVRLPENPDTFALLLQFAYTGKYSPAFQAGNIYVADRPACFDGMPHFCGFCGRETSSRSGYSCPMHACAAAHARCYPLQFCLGCGEPGQDCADHCGLMESETFLKLDLAFLKLQYNITGVGTSIGYRSIFKPSGTLLLHATLFVLADQYMIQKLRELCLHRLHLELCFFKPGAQAIKELCLLIDCAMTFSELDDGRHDLEPPLLKLVLAYLVFEARALVRYKAFRECMKQHSDLLDIFYVKAITSLGNTIQEHIDSCM